MKSNITRATLTDNYTISRILKGGWQLSEGHGPKIDRKVAVEDMFRFIEAGITTFDCADIYVGVEELIGEFRKLFRKRYGKERLSQIKIHTKFVPDLADLATLDRKDVEKVTDRSLLRLGMNRLDLVQFHWWDYEIPRYIEVAHFLDDLQREGKILHLGTTNFDVTHLKEIVDDGVKIVSNQVQYSVLDKRPENGMLDFCQRRGIKLVCYGTLAGGFLSEGYLGVKEPKPPFENRSLVKYKIIIEEFGDWELFQKMLKTLKGIADKYDVSIANVASRYILDKPEVVAVIIGARNVEHIESSLRVFKFSLDKEDLALIDKVVKQAKGPSGELYGLERVVGGRHGSIMKYNLNKLQEH